MPAKKKSRASSSKKSVSAPAKKAAKKPAKKPGAAVVLSWEDDPMSVPGASPIQRPVPNLANSRLAIRIDGPKPAPKVYPSISMRSTRAAAAAIRQA